MLNGSVILKNVTPEFVSQRVFEVHSRSLHTSFWHLYPHIMFIEAVPVGVEPRQLSPIIVLHVPAPIHGSILLVTENNAITGLALSCAFTALTAHGLFFVAFELSLAASKTGNQTVEISRIPWRDRTSPLANSPSCTRPHCLVVIFLGIELAPSQGRK
jgi:hypothetical protein